MKKGGGQVSQNHKNKYRKKPHISCFEIHIHIHETNITKKKTALPPFQTDGKKWIVCCEQEQDKNK